MRGGNSTDGKFIVIKCIGEGDNVDEFILFGNSNDYRIWLSLESIGDDMNFN